MRKIVLGILAIVTVVIGSASILGVASARHGTVDTQYEVTITNLTGGQIFSPALIATHRAGFGGIYKLGAPASGELAQVAEDAVNGPLEAALLGDPKVLSVVTLTGAGGPIMPGETATVLVTSKIGFPRISLVGMLVTTNDAFYGMNGTIMPASGGKTVFLRAYDAGTETNTETCVLIPGPPCGNIGQRDVAGAEGYVHVHSGIHGVGDLNPVDADWNNPVAKVTSHRVD